MELKYHKTSFPVPFVLHVQLNRPKKLNAVNKEFYLEYGRLIRDAELDENVRVILVSGEGRAFCAGLDMGSSLEEISLFSTKEPLQGARLLRDHIKEFQSAIGAPEECAKPVLGVGHGPCIGLAIDMLSAMDIRFLARDAMLSIREIEIGLAADIGTLQRFPRLVNNVGWAKELAFSGRNFDADEALSQGFAQFVHDTKDEAIKAAIEYASMLASKVPHALEGTKRAINYGLDHSIHDGLEQIAEYNGVWLSREFKSRL